VRISGGLAAVAVMALGSLAPVWAQAPAPAPTEEKKPDEAKPEEKKPKTLWDEFKLVSFIESGATLNLHGGSIGIPGSTSSGDTNLLRPGRIARPREGRRGARRAGAGAISAESRSGGAAVVRFTRDR